jgi:hypothetical protein
MITSELAHFILFYNKLIYIFVIFMATKKNLGQKIIFSSPLLLMLLVSGSEIRDPGWVKIRIRY